MTSARPAPLSTSDSNHIQRVQRNELCSLWVQLVTTSRQHISGYTSNTMDLMNCLRNYIYPLSLPAQPPSFGTKQPNRMILCVYSKKGSIYVVCSSTSRLQQILTSRHLQNVADVAIACGLEWLVPLLSVEWLKLKKCIFSF